MPILEVVTQSIYPKCNGWSCAFKKSIRPM